MKKEDFDAILKNTKNYDVDWETGVVTSKAQPNVEYTDKQARLVRAAHVIYEACCKAKSYSNEDEQEAYARRTFEEMLPFFNDFQLLIRTSAEHMNGISANDIENVIMKHEEDFKHFYAVTDDLLTRKHALKAFMEYTLHRDLKNIKLDFSQSNGPSYVSKIGVEFIQ